MELVYKEELVLEEGWIIYKDRIVDIGWNIINQINGLELAYQRARYNAAHKQEKQEPQKDFEYESEFWNKIELVPETPTIDEAVERGKQMFQELKLQDILKHTQDMLNTQLCDLVEWIQADRIMIDVNPTSEPHRIDTKYLPCLLYMEIDGLVEIVKTCIEEHAFPDTCHDMFGCGRF